MVDTQVGHYQVHDLLGAGGIGRVYRATDLILRRQVALKFIPAELFDRNEAAPCLLQEARAAAALNHSNIATIYEVGQTEGGLYIAQEFVEGETLARRIEHGPLAIRAALAIALQIAAALRVAHGCRIIHCDLKSANLLITPDDRVKVLDFGLARLAGSRFENEGNGAGTTSALNALKPADNGSASTSTKTINGSIGYLSPEQARGQPLDERTDLFSLGVVLYEIVASRRPFSAGSLAEELRATCYTEPRPLSTFRDDVPLQLESIVRRALAKNRDQRYQSAEDIFADLKSLHRKLDQSRSRSVPSFDSPAAKTRSLDHYQADSVNRLANWIGFWRSRRRWFLLTGFLVLVLSGGLALATRGWSASWLGCALLFGLAAFCFFAYRWLGRVPVKPVSLQPEGVAFRGLLPFQGADRERFYGREIQTQSLFTMVTQQRFRFGVLFGDSGCGKTSLLGAGLIPRLWEEGYLPLYCRSFRDPLAALLEECRQRSRVEPQAEEAPIDYLRRVSHQLDAHLILICDQFEEFFVNHRTASEREPFIEFVSGCESVDLRVTFLFSLRSDFLYLINAAFAGRVSEPLLSSKLYHLQNFDEQAATDIVERSALAAGLPFEEGFSRHISRDLARDHEVAPSELQIVGTQLQARQIFTRESYQKTGGKEALVHDFLEDVIKSSGDAESARLLLRTLISEDNTRVTLTIAEICKRTQRSHESVTHLLELLANARLVRALQEEEPWRYELMHEYLIDKINQVTGHVLDATQRANRHFRQYLSNYALDQRTRVPLARLWFIRRYSNLQRGTRERELLRKSGLAGVMKMSAAILLLTLVTGAASAFLSVNEMWDSKRFSDGHTAAARRVVFSPDGQRLASCGEDGKIIVWDFARRQRIKTLTDHQGWVNAIDYSPDGNWLASAGQDHTIIIWNASTFERIAVLREHRSGVNTVVFSPDGKLLVSASSDADARTIVWEVNAWRKAREFPRGIKWGQLLISPDSRRIVCPSGWSIDVATGNEITAAQKGFGVYGALDAERGWLLSIGGDGYIGLIDMRQEKAIAWIRAHQFHGRAAIYSPDRRLFATGSEDIVLWDAATQTKLLRLPYVAEVWGLAFSHNGRWLVSSHNDGAILLWDVQERENTARFSEHSGSVRAVAFSPNGKQLASASEDRSVIVWNVADGRKEATLVGHNTRVTGVAFSPKGDWLVATDQDGEAILWDVTERRPRWRFRPNIRFPNYCVTVSPDGRWIAHSNGVNDSNDGRLVAEMQNVAGRAYGMAFSGDGRKLTAVFASGHLLVWDTQTWQVIQQTKLENAQLICISFAPDGQHFVTGEDEGVIRLWQTENLQEVSVIGRHQARIKTVRFSPDGREVVSAGDDQMISLWSVSHRRLITNLGTHTAPVLALDFSPDGKQIASGGQDKSVRLYARRQELWGYGLD